MYGAGACIKCIHVDNVKILKTAFHFNVAECVWFGWVCVCVCPVLDIQVFIKKQKKQGVEGREDSVTGAASASPWKQKGRQ